MSKYPPYIDGLPLSSPLRRMGELAFDDGHLAAIAELEGWVETHFRHLAAHKSQALLADKLNSMKGEGEEEEEK